jgi:DNA primase
MNAGRRLTMSTFVDFEDLKARIKIEQMIPLLGLRMRQNGVQYRGPCLACKQGGERGLALNSAKQSYYCFSERKGGDLIGLVAHTRGIAQKDAAAYLVEQFGNGQPARRDTSHSVSNSSPSPPAQRDRELKPLDYLVFNEAVEGLGLTEATCKAWGAGYAPKGIMRGRLAVPIHDRAGTLLAYVGIAMSPETSPRLHFPNGFDPHAVIFGADRVKEGELCLVRDPLDVLTAYQSGIENVVAFLAPITAQQVEMLAALMDAARCETVELF